MSDSRLRELDRRWKESGNVDDEAALLRERVRVGDFSQEKLQLAALLGYEAAKVVTSQELRTPGNFSNWVDMLAVLGEKEAVIRATVAALRVTIDQINDYPPGHPVHVCVVLMEDWIILSSGGDTSHCLATFREFFLDLSIDDPLWNTIGEVRVAMSHAQSEARYAVRAIDALPEGVIRGGCLDFESAFRANPILRRIVTQIIAELLPWVLGTGDPVADRAREREEQGRQGEVRDGIGDVLED